MTDRDPPPPVETASAGVDRFVAALLEDGQATPGTFTLDRAAAREALSRFQLADPVHYVGEVVQAAVAAGATRVDLQVDADEARFTFDGRPLAREDCELLYEAALGDRVEPASAVRRQLALAVHGALGLEPELVRIRSGDGCVGVRLETRPGVPDASGPERPSVAGTEVYVRRRLGGEVAARAIGQLTGASPEEVRLREVCVRCPIPVTVNGRPVPSLRPEAERSRTVEGVSVWVGVGPPPGDGNPIAFVQHGVVVGTAPAPGPWATGLVATVASAGLRRDLSLAGVVQDAAYRSAVAAADQVHRELVAERFHAVQRARRLVWTPEDRRVVAQALGLGVVPLDAERSRMKVFPMFGGSTVPVPVAWQHLEARARSRGAVRFLVGSAEGLDPAAVRGERDALWCDDPGLIRAIAARLGLPLVDVREELEVPYATRARPLRWLRLAALPVVLGLIALFAVAMWSRDDEDGLASSFEDCDQKGGEACERLAAQLEELPVRLSSVADEARQSRTRACETRHWPSCDRLLRQYTEGPEPGRDLREAHRILVLACDHEHAQECARIEEVFLAMPPAVRAAVVATDARSCDQARDEQACFRVGLRRLLGLGVPEDAALGGRVLGPGCDRGYRIVCVAAGLPQPSEGRGLTDKRLSWWAGHGLLAHCRSGHLRACGRVGMAIAEDLAGMSDPPAAWGLLTKGCEAGDFPSCRWQAEYHLRHDEIDPGRALLRRTCLRGDPPSCSRLGAILGEDRPSDLAAPELRTAFERACEQREPRCCLLLSNLLRQGIGGVRDPARALVLARRACEGGVPEACGMKE